MQRLRKGKDEMYTYFTKRSHESHDCLFIASERDFNVLLYPH